MRTYIITWDNGEEVSVQADCLDDMYKILDTAIESTDKPYIVETITDSKKRVIFTTKTSDKKDPTQVI